MLAGWPRLIQFSRGNCYGSSQPRQPPFAPRGGAEADGAISGVCPRQYLRNVAVPAMREGAAQAGRNVPPLIAHAPVCVHDDVAEMRAAVREQMSNYPASPFYQQMFAEAGFAEALETLFSRLVYRFSESC